MTKRIAVIGGGIAGLTAAYQLLKQGFEVELFERNSDVASECSYANGAQFSVSNSQTLHTWTNIKKGLSWMFKKDAPLYIQPSLDPDKIKWVSSFLKETVLGTHFENSIETIELGMESRREWNSYLSNKGGAHKVGQAKDYPGMLLVYSNSVELEKAESLVDIIENYNYTKWSDNPTLTFERITDEEMRKDKSMQYFSKTAGGLLFKEDGIADINRLCKLLLTDCLDNKNFIYSANSDVADILKSTERSNGILLQTGKFIPDFDFVVIANGWQADRLGKQFGTNLGIYPVKGYSITIDCLHNDLPPSYSINHDTHKIVCSTFDYNGWKKFRVAGTMELSGNEDPPSMNQDRIKPLKDWVSNNFDVRSMSISPWACYRPMTPDMMPFYDHSKNDNTVWYHAGHGHLGLTLSMGTAVRLAKKIAKSA